MRQQSGETLVLDGAVSRGVSEEVVKGPWPEIRIVRMADIHVPAEAAQWGDFLNRFGRANYGIGNAKALGSIGMSYVSAVEMGRMLQRKYPGVYENRRKTQQLHGRIRNHYNDFVRESGRREVQRIAEEGQLALKLKGQLTLKSTEGDNLDESEVLLRSEISAIERRVANAKLWLPSTVVTREIVPVGRNRVAFGLSDEEGIYEEYASTLDFLSQEGLDTSRLDPQPLLHATFFIRHDHMAGGSEYRMPKENREGDVHPASMRFAPPTAR